MAASAVTPVTLLTGFLGSGKTTLLNRLLRDPAAADTAVLINEFGQVSIDHHLVREASENLMVMSNGCICCSVAGDMVQALRDLYFRRANGEVPAFRRVVVETTGLADPAPILHTLIEMPLVAARYALSGIVTTVDAVHGMSQLDRHPEALKQAAVADRLVITKSDLAPPGALDARLATLNPGAQRFVGMPAAARLLDTGVYQPDRKTPDVRAWLNAAAYRPVGGPRHDPRVAAFVWTHPAPLDWDALADALETLAATAGERLLRMKGIVSVAGHPRPRVVHGVQHTLYPAADLPAWPDEDHATRLVFITRDLPESQVRALLDRLAGTLEHAA